MILRTFMPYLKPSSVVKAIIKFNRLVVLMASRPFWTQQEVQDVAQTKSQTHDAMIANGWVMPNKKSSFNTMKVFKQIRQELLWVPSATDVTVMALCARPPPNKQLLVAIKDEIDAAVLADPHTHA